jgi:hypothetical protein
MSSEESRAYVLIEIQPGEEKQFAEYVMAKGLLKDINLERMDFVHGSFDVVVILRGKMKNIDAKIMELRKSKLIRRTETLLCFGEMLSWDDMSGRLNE